MEKTAHCKLVQGGINETSEMFWRYIMQVKGFTGLFLSFAGPFFLMFSLTYTNYRHFLFFY